MQKINNLVIHNLRSHSDAKFIFHPEMNAIVGPNGSGKTSLIEALYTLLRGTSFKGSITEMVQYGKNEFQAKIDISTINTTHSRTLSYRQSGEITEKKWKIDEKKYGRLPINARLPVVLFEPDLAKLITGGPDRRRNYLDQIASQLSFETANILNRYERTLKQRNKLLKQLRKTPNHTAPDEIFSWNAQLAQLGEKLITARLSVIKKLQPKISKYYEKLGGSDEIFLSYKSSVSTESTNYGSKLLQFLETSFKRDMILGYTSFGPHRDDLEIRLADQPANERASRGEVRTVVIALKLLETEILSKHYIKDGIKPTLLLDDVLSELDLVHQERVLAGLKDHQVFITTTDAHALTPGVHTIALE